MPLAFLYFRMVKKIYGYLIAAFISILFLLPNSVYASHAAGGEIAYEWVKDSTYRVYFKFYRDCTGAGEPASGAVQLCYRNTCNNQGGSRNLIKLTKLPDSTINGNPVSLGCPPNGTRCSNSSSSVPGYREWWYTDTITLTSRCANWRFTVCFGARNPSTNLVSANTKNFFVEATLNNVVAQGNSSPFFSVKPVPSVCINQPYTYNNGAVDPNSDSLVFEMIQPLEAPVTCAAGGPTATAITFDPSGSPSYNLTNNPIQTSNTFSLSSSTGQMTFTPSLVGPGTVSVRVKEYRNGVLIGSVMRDVQVQVIACSVPSPIVNTVSGSITGATYINGRVEACAGLPMSFCFDLKSSNSSAILVASDNHSAAAPGSTVNYIGQLSDSIRGCFNWTPGTLDTGLRVFSVTAKDSTCTSPGVAVSQTFVLPVYIWPITDIIKDTSICLGDSVQLLAVGGSVFTWSVIAGGSPLTTLSCTTCKQPFAKPTMLTKYIVNNSGASYCNKNSDTVTVNVLDYSSIKPDVGGNSPVCTGDSIKLTAVALPAGFSYSWTGPATFTSVIQNAYRTNTQLNYAGNYILRGKKDNCFTSPDTVAISVNESPSTPVAANNGPLCSGKQLNLTASLINNVTYSWTGPASFSSNTQNPIITSVQTTNAGVYSVRATSTINGCTSQSGNTTVVVIASPDIDTYSYTHPTTCGGFEGSVTLTGLLGNTLYAVDYKKNGVSQSQLMIATNNSGVLVLSGLTQGIYSQIILTRNGCTSDTILPITLTDPVPPVISYVSSANPTTCLGTQGTITVGGLTNGSTYTINYKKNSVSQPQVSLVANSSGRVIISGLTAGTYDNITASLGNCTSNTLGSYVLTDPAPPTISSSNNTPVCEGDTIKLFATGPPGATYIWSGPNSFTSIAEDTIIANSIPLQSGNYSVTGKLNNCNSTPSVTAVTVKPKPSTPIAANNGPICSDETLNLTASNINNATYSWSGPQSFSSSTQNPSITDVDTSAKGDYNVIAIVDGCPSSPGLTNVVIYQTPQIDTFTFSNPTSCSGFEGSITLTGLLPNSLYDVNYYKNGISQGPLGSATNSQGKLTLNGLSQGVYSRISVTINDCTSDTIMPITLVDPTPPVINIVSSANPITCLGSEGTITIGGIVSGQTYTVSYKKNSNAQAPVALLANGLGRVVLTGLTAGTYDNIVVTISNCNSNSVGAVVLSDPLPPVIVASNNAPVCQGDTIKLFTSGPSGTTYSWTGPNSFTSTAKDTFIANSIITQSGIYTVTGILANCTSLPSNTTVTVKSIPATPIAANNGPLCSGSTLSLTASTVTNATYSWTGPNSFISSLQNPLRNNIDTADSGTYVVKAIIDGCQSLPGTTQVTIYQTPEIDTYLYAHPTTCLGNEGYIRLAGLLPNVSYTLNYKLDGVAQMPVTISTNSSGQLSINNLIKGAYSQIRVTVNNCTSDTLEPINLADPIPPVITLVSSTNPTTCLGNQGTIVIGGLTSGLTYAINYKKNSISQSSQLLLANGSGNITLSGLNAATYDDITVTINNCTSNIIGGIVLTDPLPPVILANNNTPLCQGDTIKLFASGPPGTTYTWTGPGPFTSSAKDTIIANSVPFQSGVYSVTGILANCTSSPVNTTVTVKPTPVTPLAGNNGPLCSGSTLTLSATSVTNATYQWTGPNSFVSSLQNPLRNNVDTADSGTYVLIAIVDGCPSAPAITQVTIYQTPEIDTYLSTHPITCGGNEGYIELSGLIPNTTYAVNLKKNGNPQTTASLLADGAGIIRISGLFEAEYSQITVKLNNCISDTTKPIILTDPTPPVISSFDSTYPTTCLGIEGTISLHGLSAGKGYTVNYTKNGIAQPPVMITADGSGIVVMTSLSAGLYSDINVTINNCTSNDIDTIILVDPVPPVVVAGNNTPVCEEDTVVLTANSSSGVTYSWTGPNSYATNVKDTTILNALPVLTGAYIVTATINNCTSEPDTTTVVVHPTPPLLNAANDGPYCTGNTIFLSADTIVGATYSWTGPLPFSSSNQNPAINNGTVANLGTYYVTATVNGCISPLDSTTVLIYPPLAPVIGSFTITHPTTCGGTQGSIALSGLTPDSTYTINYRKNGIPQAPLNITADATGGILISNLGQGSYDNIKVTLSICSSDPLGPLVLNDPLPPILVVNNNTPVCEGDTIKLYASSAIGVTYLWTGPNGFSSVTADTFIADALPSHSGTYSVTGTLHNCTSNPYTTTVVVHPTPPTPVATNNGPLCPKDILNLTASAIPGATYVWRGPNSFSSNNQNPVINNVNTTHSGNYVVYITINNCRSDSDTTAVLVNPQPVISGFTPSNPTTCSGFDGYITLTGLNPSTSYFVNFKKNGIGQPPQSIATDGSGSLSIANLEKGTYSQITVTLNSCISDTIIPVQLIDPFPPIVGASNNSPICAEDTIKLYGSSLPGVIYSWTGPNGFTSSSKDTFIAAALLVNGGIYAVTGTLANCTSAPVITTVVVKPKPLKPIAASNAPLCEGKTLNLTATTIPTATYSWGGPSFSSNIQNPSVANAIPAMGGKYYVRAIINGCYSNADTTTVLVNPYPLAPVVSSPLLLCQHDVASPLTATGQNLLWYTAATGGVGNATPPVPSTSAPGTTTWWVSQTDGNGCEGYRASITVKVNNQPTKPQVISPIVYCQGDTTYQLTAQGSNLTWYIQATGGSGVSTAPTPSSITAGTFDWWVSQTDGNGCESQREKISVLVKPKPLPPGVAPVLYCTGDMPFLLKADGQSLTWYPTATGGSGSSTPPTPSTADTGTTNYYVTQKLDGCESDRALLAVTVNPRITANILTDRDTICQHDTLMISNGTVNPASANYNWDFAGADILSGTGEGPYLISWGTNGIKTINLEISNLNCSASHSKTLLVVESPTASFELRDNICAGELVELKPYWDYFNVVKYVWSFDGGIITDTSSYNTYYIYWPTPGKRTVTLITYGKNGCASKPRVHPVDVRDAPVGAITGISNNDFCAWDSIMVTADYNSTYLYQWFPEAYFPTRKRTNEVMATPGKTGYLTVKITDDAGCSKYDSIMVRTKPCCEITLPNAFTPNNDGLNDRFKVITIGHHDILSFIVLNRWGQEIYRSNNELEGWDGRFKNIPQDMGTYNYYISYKCADGEIYEKKGEVILVR